MKKAALFILVMILLSLIVSCTKEYRDNEQRIAVSFVKRVTYIKDTRTNLCFAKEYRTLANVPCENIPPEMLYSSDGKTKNNDF